MLGRFRFDFIKIAFGNPNINIGEAYGRPVQIIAQPGGIVYISDDKAGVIYRIFYGG